MGDDLCWLEENEKVLFSSVRVERKRVETGELMASLVGRRIGHSGRPTRGLVEERLERGIEKVGFWLQERRSVLVVEDGQLGGKKRFQFAEGMGGLFG